MGAFADRPSHVILRWSDELPDRLMAAQHVNVSAGTLSALNLRAGMPTRRGPARPIHPGKVRP